jgi:hypothetical protein
VALKVLGWYAIRGSMKPGTTDRIKGKIRKKIGQIEKVFEK